METKSNSNQNLETPQSTPQQALNQQQEIEKISLSEDTQFPKEPINYFCSKCRKIVVNICDEVDHGREFLIPYSQLETDFCKYKLYCEQNDPLYNIAKGLNKIQDALKYLEIPELKEDFQLKQKVFDENSKPEDFIDKIIYKDNRFLIDDLQVLKNLDKLKNEQFLIDIIQNNYHIIKQFLNKYQQYRYENNNQNEELNIKAENMSDSSEQEIDYNTDNYNQKRKGSNFFDASELDNYPRKKKLTQDSIEVSFPNNNYSMGGLSHQQSIADGIVPPQNGNGAGVLNSQFLPANSAYEDIANEDNSKYKKQPIDKDIGLEHMSPKEREILQKMYSTQYEKHHRFTDVEKKMFAKFALLRKIRDGINVSVTTEQWKLNRITVQLWLDKYKKLLKQKHEI